MRISATEAKNRFGQVCALAKQGPVWVEKAGRVDTVILSAQDYEALSALQNRPGLDARRQQFESEFAGWLTAQEAWVDAHGVPGAEWRPW